MQPLKMPDPVRIGVIGLGYVGLPLAVEFGKHYPTMGYDINAQRVDALRDGRTLGAEGIRAFGKPECVVYDVKCILPRDAVDRRL